MEVVRSEPAKEKRSTHLSKEEVYCLKNRTKKQPQKTVGHQLAYQCSWNQSVRGGKMFKELKTKLSSKVGRNRKCKSFRPLGLHSRMLG